MKVRYSPTFGFKKFKHERFSPAFNCIGFTKFLKTSKYETVNQCEKTEAYIFRTAVVLPATVLQVPHCPHFFARTWNPISMRTFVTMREQTVCQLQCCCCIRAWLWAEPERQPICEKFEKETNTRYNFMQKILEWWKDLICSMNLMKNLLVIVNSPSSNEEPSFWGQYGIDADAWIVTDQIDNGSKTLESIL